MLASVSKSVNHSIERSPTGKFAEFEEYFQKAVFYISIARTRNNHTVFSCLSELAA